MKRNRLKTLDEYYHIRANITSRSIAQVILNQSKLRASTQDQSWLLVVTLGLLLMTWLCLVLSVFTELFSGSVRTVLTHV
jgi:hypothetical protein